MTDPKSDPAPSGFRAPPQWVVFLFLLLGMAAVGAAFLLPMTRPAATTPTDPVVVAPEFPEVPPFLLTERDGTAIDNTALDGKVWVAEFAFTRCKLCPQVSATMAKLRSELKLTDRDDFRLVTFTVDPEHDTADELKKYAERFTKPDDRRWLFLRGPRKYMELLCRRGFKLGLEEKPDAPPELRFDHYLELLVIDKRGKVRGHYPGLPPDREGGQAVFDEGYAEMKKKLEEVLKE